MKNNNPPGIPLDMPMYKNIKQKLLQSLTQGDWKAGEAIPSERHLAERFGNSIGTVRKAIDALVAENILIRQQGRGTFVASHTRDRMLFYFFHIMRETGPKTYPHVEFPAFDSAKAERLAAERLEIAPSDPVFRIRNRLHLDGTPVMIDNIVVPAASFPKLTKAMFRDRPSTIYNLYEEAFGISVVRTSERLRATVANANTAATLEIARDSPLLQIRRVAYTYSDQPVEFRVSLVNTARHEYCAEIGAN